MVWLENYNKLDIVLQICYIECYNGDVSMTMHMAPIFVSTVNNGKIKKKLTAPQLRAKAEHEAWLKKRGLHPDQLKAKKSKKRDTEESTFTYESRRTVPTSNTVGNGFKKEENKYTGTLITGIATMHKSNAVPVINKKQAEEISSMRR